MEIGEKIKKKRIEKKWTQKRLAEKLGVNSSLISQYERGTRRPKLETINNIAKALGVPKGYFAEKEPLSSLSVPSEKFEEIEKANLIQDEKIRLEVIFNDISDKMRQLVGGLIEQAAFLKISVIELQNNINLKGYSTLSPQGVKKRPEADLYISMQKSYMAIIKQLSDICDKHVEEIMDGEEKDFENFLDGKG